MPKRKRNGAAPQGPLRRSARLIQRAQTQAQAQGQQANNQQANNQVPVPVPAPPPAPVPVPVPAPELAPDPQLEPEQALPQEVQDRNVEKIRRTRDNARIQHWMANHTWPAIPANERFGLIDPSHVPYFVGRSTASIQARAAAAADWEVEEERGRSPEGSDGAYNVENCTARLRKYRILMRDRGAGVPRDVRNLCRDLLGKDSEVPRDTVFDLETFPRTCERLLTKDDLGVNRLIGELIVPSAETAIDRGLADFQHYSVAMSEVWKWILPLEYEGEEELMRPQTGEQIQKMNPYSGVRACFRCTASMYFPFLTTEIRTRELLDMADVQNTYSAGLAAGGIVELFRSVEREAELHRQVLAFSISHSHRIVRIYAHYVMFDDGRVTYYGHLAREYNLTPETIGERWACYKFVMALYNDWAPGHHRRLCSAIDNLPNPVAEPGGASD
ncbi:hypothetical protein BJX64DRAFT_284715 [Aspergillus heterothallicus]